jgi:tetratricopeptide (TPR) repeat protein
MAFTNEIEKLERRWSENQLGLTFAPLAEAYRKAGDTSRALDLLESGLSQHPNYVPGHIVRGRCHLDVHADGAAELAFLRVVELDPENVIALKSLAELSERSGRLAEAILRLELLLDVDRNNEDARGELDRVKELHAADPGIPDVGPIESLTPVVPDAFDVASMLDMKVMDGDVLTASEHNEFQSPSDAETLHASEDRIVDLVLGGEPLEQEFPQADAAQGHGMIAPPDPLRAEGLDEVDALLGLDYLSMMGLGIEPMATIQVPATEFPDLPEVEVSGDVVMFESALQLRDAHGPNLDVAPEPPPPALEEAPVALEPAFEAEPEPVLEPVLEADPEPVFEAAAEPEAEPESEPFVAAEEPEAELVVTETMAEIFLRQGHRELALAVYTQLSLRDPDHPRIAEAVARLKPEAPAPEPATPPQQPIRFAAADTGGRSVAELFSALLAAIRPAVATAVHPPAIEPPKRVGEPTRPAQDALSLSAVFGDEGTGSPPAGTSPAHASSEPSFDEFFAPATGSSSDVELPRGPSAEPQSAPAQAPEDLEQFNSWLRGLKR